MATIITINNGVDWSHEILSASRTQMIVQFTDETEVDAGESSPTNWLWNFGDGHFSTVQHPEHTFRGKFSQIDQEFTSATHNVEYTVSLTTWSGGTYKNWLTYLPATTLRFRGVTDIGYSSFGSCQSAQRRRLPMETWTYLNNGSMQYEIAHPTSWRYTCQYTERLVDLSAHTEATFVGYTTFGINTFWWGTRYYSGRPYSVRTGKWNTTANTWMPRIGNVEDEPNKPNEYDVQHIRWLTAHPAIRYVSLDISKFAGLEGVQVFRIADGWEWNMTLQAYGLSGYVFYLDPLYFAAWVGILEKNKGVKSKTITPTELVISRPAILYSGIREAYFSDGWEDRKNFFLEVSKAHPCTIQFFDLYVNTTNE